VLRRIAHHRIGPANFRTRCPGLSDAQQSESSGFAWRSRQPAGAASLLQLSMAKGQLLPMLTVVKAKSAFLLHTGDDRGFVDE